MDIWIQQLNFYPPEPRDDIVAETGLPSKRALRALKFGADYLFIHDNCSAMYEPVRLVSFDRKYIWPRSDFHPNKT